MEDNYWSEYKREIERREEIERQEAAVQLQAAQLRVAQEAAEAQMLQNAQIVAAMEEQSIANQELADLIERGQQAWAEAELVKAKLQQQKAEKEEFAREQCHKIHDLWQRLKELDMPDTPGGKFMTWKGIVDGLRDIDVDAVHDIAFLDRDHEVRNRLSEFIVALITEYPEFAFIAHVDDYDNKTALAKRLQKQPFFRTFAESNDAHILLTLRRKYPELNIPNCDTYPQKRCNFVQDVMRLKNLCALLGGNVENDPPTQTIILSAFNLDPAVFGEKEWADVPSEKLSNDEIRFYYRFYRNAKVYDYATSANALQHVFESLAKILKINAVSVERLRRVERVKLDEVVTINEEIKNIAEAKQRKEEERLRKEEEKRRRAEEEREKQRRQQMNDDLVDALFKLLRNHHGGIEPYIQSKNAIKFDNRLLGYSNNTYFFGNRVLWYDFKKKIAPNNEGNILPDKITVCNIHVVTWKALVERDGNFFNDARDAFLKEFQKAKDILPDVDGMNDRLEIVIRSTKTWFWVSFVFSIVLGPYLIGLPLGAIFDDKNAAIIAILFILSFSFLIFCCVYLPTYFWKQKIQKIIHDSPTVDSLVHNLQSNNFHYQIGRK